MKCSDSTLKQQIYHILIYWFSPASLKIPTNLLKTAFVISEFSGVRGPGTAQLGPLLRVSLWVMIKVSGQFGFLFGNPTWENLLPRLFMLLAVFVSLWLYTWRSSLLAVG